MQVQFRRPDGTFVAIVDGFPYHVVPSDPLFTEAQEAGADAPFEPVPEPPSIEELRAQLGAAVTAERDRRIEVGTVIDVAGHGAVGLQGRQIDRDNLSDLAVAASLRIGMGAGDTITNFRDRDNVIHQLTQPQVLDLWMQAAAYVSSIYEHSWALKDGGEIPADFAADQYWR